MKNTCAIKKYQWLAEQICDYCARAALPVSGFLPSEVELSEKFKVNRLTVRRALQHLESRRIVSPVTGKRRRLLTDFAGVRETQLVACMGWAGPASLDYIFCNRVFARMYECMALDFQAHNIGLVGVPITAEVTRLPEVVRGTHVRAVLVFESLPADMRIDVNLPVISVFSDKLHYNFGAEFDVAFDAFGVTARLVAKLLELGHRRLALVSPGQTGEYFATMRAGFETALIRHGITPMECLALDRSACREVAPVRDRLLEFLQRHPDVDGFVLYSNDLAPCFLEALTLANVAVPQQASVAVVGGGNDPDICGRHVTGLYNDYTGLAAAVCEYTRLIIAGQIKQANRIQLNQVRWVEGDTASLR